MEKGFGQVSRWRRRLLGRRRSRRSSRRHSDAGGLGLPNDVALSLSAILVFGLGGISEFAAGNRVFGSLLVLIAFVPVFLAVRGRLKAKAQAKVVEERRKAEEELARQKRRDEGELARQKRREVQELEKQREEAKRQRIESLLRRDAVGDEINYMSGAEFERFMADLFRQKWYGVQETKATGDQGVDLLLDVDGKRVAVQLKRWTGPVGNAVVGATFAGMAHYEADEGWIITTSAFIRSAQQLARSTRVRLIDGRELDEWLKGLAEEWPP